MNDSEVAFVTGAASGIGRATALRLASRGAAVGLFDHAADGLRETARLIRAAGGNVLEITGDVAVLDDVEAAVSRTSSELGSLRTVVGCAGVEVMGTIPDMAVDDWHKVIAVNLTGIFHTARAAIPRLVEAGGGALVAMSSDAGVQGAASFGAYCASKHGVIGLVRSLALDHGPQHVRCNAVCPGFVETPMAERIFAGTTQEEREAWARTVPLGRFAQPEEVAASIAFLSSDEAAYVNGHAYVLDGGATAGYFEV
jgi:NAD(P)-dependent dehydrogenase (short-subunit alcohol dehydrogenase family)